MLSAGRNKKATVTGIYDAATYIVTARTGEHFKKMRSELQLLDLAEANDVPVPISGHQPAPRKGARPRKKKA